MRPAQARVQGGRQHRRAANRLSRNHHQSADGEGKFIRQSGGRGQYGHACVQIQPNEKGKGIEIENKIVGGAIPKEYIPAVIDGCEEAIKGGVLAGYQMIDVKVQVVDGTFHEVDSNELAFKMAGIFAFKDAAKKAHMILLEPIMKVEVTTPDEYQGDLLGDISRRRGHIVSIEAKLGQTILNAQVPLAEMFGYATAIRSLSKGRASYSMEPLTFEQVPKSVLGTILDAASKKPAARSKKSDHQFWLEFTLQRVPARTSYSLNSNSATMSWTGRMKSQIVRSLALPIRNQCRSWLHKVVLD